MPRPCRIHVAGGVYHAVLRGNHQQAIFNCRDDYLRFEDIVAAAMERYAASLLAYCWMTNHVHLAIQVGDAPLGSMMRVIASRYARWRQRAVPTTGHLFERRYRARLVDADRYLLALVRYVHRNPLRAHLVDDLRDYPWSSHHAYLGAHPPDWLRTGPALELLGSTAASARMAYQHFMAEEPPAPERDALSLAHRTASSSRPAQHRSALSAPATRLERLPRSLEEISAEVALEFGVGSRELKSRRRHPELVRARVEITRRALREGAASLSQVAQHLGRAPSTLSDLLHSGRHALPKP